MTYYKEVINRDTKIVFEELVNPPLLEASIAAAVSICVYQDKKIIARYYKEFSYKLTEQLFYILTQRFLKSSIYRNKMQHTGEWDGKFKVSSTKKVNKNGINQNCLKAIAYVNTIENPGINDLLMLKTFGRDLFSNRKKEELISSLAALDIRRIQQEFYKDVNREQLMIKAIRWLARGLNVEHAIRKVRLDEDLASAAAKIYR